MQTTAAPSNQLPESAGGGGGGVGKGACAQPRPPPPRKAAMTSPNSSANAQTLWLPALPRAPPADRACARLAGGRFAFLIGWFAPLPSVVGQSAAGSWGRGRNWRRAGAVAVYKQRAGAALPSSASGEVRERSAAAAPGQARGRRRGAPRALSPVPAAPRPVLVSPARSLRPGAAMGRRPARW